MGWECSSCGQVSAAGASCTQSQTWERVNLGATPRPAIRTEAAATSPVSDPNTKTLGHLVTRRDGREAPDLPTDRGRCSQ